ncbi:chemokine-like factor [Trachemys scripta elegans]|uniref:chemokine-like factor n=1 Tax=Trachemys scripta elegans TaxID=31138 RepID=UPI00155582E8|nr:chemokine-like factor [Trachemys scripta elegans]
MFRLQGLQGTYLRLFPSHLLSCSPSANGTYIQNLINGERSAVAGNSKCEKSGQGVVIGTSKSHEAFIALAIMEFVITLLFFVLFLPKLDKKIKFLFWPLADIFNSLIAVLFFIIVCLCAIIIKTTTGTLVGGVFGLLLVVLCIADSVLLFKKITFNKPRGRNVITR